MPQFLELKSCDLNGKDFSVGRTMHGTLPVILVAYDNVTQSGDLAGIIKWLGDRGVAESQARDYIYAGLHEFDKEQKKNAAVNLVEIFTVEDGNDVVVILNGKKIVQQRDSWDILQTFLHATGFTVRVTCCTPENFKEQFGTK